MATESTLSIVFLSTTRLGEKGQLTIPKGFRQALALETGAPIAVLQLGSGLLLIPEKARFRDVCDRVSRTFSRHGVNANEVLATLPATRERVFRRLYPRLAKQRRTKKETRSRAGRR
jgi:bifunctional DNA-binding transcriptional regulator/antitoxin component of YhaV-PrlF toxin-antitoxin module